MGIFTKQNDTPAFLLDDADTENAAAEQLNHSDVLNYLIALDDDAYEKLQKVINVYRKAEKQVAEIMGNDEETAPAEVTAADMSEQELDDHIEGFLETAPAKAKSNGKNK